jgi:hypothetical protein
METLFKVFLRIADKKSVLKTDHEFKNFARSREMWVVYNYNARFHKQLDY